MGGVWQVLRLQRWAEPDCPWLQGLSKQMTLGKETEWGEGESGTDVRRRLQLKGRARVRSLEEHAEGPGKSLRAGGQ